MPDDWTADKIDGLLHEKHNSDPWVYFSQLRSRTGARAARTIDAYAMHVWPSKFRAISYEIKVDRSDFMAELDDFTKRDPFLENSTEFYYVVPHGLVKPSEVPKQTGLMWAQAGEKQGRVVRKKAAPQGESLDTFDAAFVASLLREAGQAYEGEKIFHLAGRDLSHEDLQDWIDQKTEERFVDYQFRKDMKEDIKEEMLEDGWRKYKEVYRWIADHRRQLGIQAFSLDADDLQQWWNEIDGVDGDTTQKIVRKIERAEKKLNEIKENILPHPES